MEEENAFCHSCVWSTMLCGHTIGELGEGGERRQRRQRRRMLIGWWCGASGAAGEDGEGRGGRGVQTTHYAVKAFLPQNNTVHYISYSTQAIANTHARSVQFQYDACQLPEHLAQNKILN